MPLVPNSFALRLRPRARDHAGMTRRSISPAGRDIIKAFEGIEDGNPATVNLDPYLCPAGVWTIGWGHAITVKDRQLRGKADRAAARAAYPDGITLAEAEALLSDDLAPLEIYLQAVLPWLTQPQFDALASFIFNVGIGAFEQSTLLKRLRTRDFAGAAAQFARWNKSNGVVLAGLTRRRTAERALFLSPQ